MEERPLDYADSTQIGIRSSNDIDVAGHPGVIRLGVSGGCTGVMIGPRLILTAAHCVDLIYSPFEVRVEYFEPGRDPDDPRDLGLMAVNTYLHSSHVPWASADVPPEYANHDIAVVERVDPRPWPGTDYHDYLRVYADTASDIPSSLRLFGQGYSTISGHGFGTLRSESFDVVDVRDFRITFDITHKRGVCRGDSGGPWLLPDVPFVACIESVGALDNNTCGQDDGLRDDPVAMCTRTVWENVGALITAHTSAPMHRLNDGSHEYIRFFDVPFINDLEGEGLDRQLAVAVTMTIL